MTPFKLSPAYKDYLWGGRRLAERYGKRIGMDVVAESWELSCHPDGLSRISGGEYDGLTLNEWLNGQSGRVLGSNCAGMTEFPLLVKLIDASRDLSVQVHPDDAYARRYENSAGKTEMWYVLECEPDAALYCGFREDVMTAQVRRAIEDDTLVQLLNRISVRKGDVFFIEPGTVHAIGAGIVIAEIQQSSNLTYRLYDYGRIDSDGNRRRLDIDKAMSVLNFKKAGLKETENSSELCRNGGCRKTLVSCRYFTVELVSCEHQIRLNTTSKSFEALLLTSGSCILRTDDAEIRLGMGETVFVPTGTGRYRMEGRCTFLRIFAGFVETVWTVRFPFRRSGIHLPRLNKAVPSEGN